MNVSQKCNSISDRIHADVIVDSRTDVKLKGVPDH